MSGNDVRCQLIFDERDTIAQLQLLFFQSLDLKQIRTRGILQCGNRGIEVAMGLIELRKLSPQLAFFVFSHAVSAMLFGVMPFGQCPADAAMVGRSAVCRNPRAIGTRLRLAG
jgi:hypothetical protein